MPAYKKVSIVIPAYNEKKTLYAIVERVQKADVLGLEKEIIIIDDGSTDKTKEICLENNIDVISHIKNLGKGSSMKTGVANWSRWMVDFRMI